MPGGQRAARGAGSGLRVRRHVEVLLRRAQDEGSTGPDVTPQDLTMLYFMITELAMHATATNPQVYRRYLAIFTDGMRAGRSGAPLPHPLSADEAAVVAQRWASRP